jgi:M6 family metalloprotease-like protein
MLAGAVTLIMAALSTPAVASGADPAATTPPSKCDMPAGTAEGRPDPIYSIRPVGIVRTIMLFVDFPDVQTTEPTQPYSSHLAPARDWFRASSYARLDLRIRAVHQWFRMPSDSTSYGFDRGISFAAHKRYVADAIHAANASVDFRPFDIVYIVPPQAASAIPFSPAFVGGPSGVRADGKVLGFAATFGQDIWTPGWGYRVLVHETGHLFGLPDLYSFDPPTGNYWDTHRFAGGWDVMGYLAGKTPDYFAWHKWHLGWLAASQIRCLNAPGRLEVVLSSVEAGEGIRLAIVKMGPTKAFAVEVRQRRGVDAEACRVGVLIYRVSANATGDGPIRVRPAAADNTSNIEACAPLYAAPFHVGQVLQTGRVRIKVTGHPSATTFTVRITRS